MQFRQCTTQSPSRDDIFVMQNANNGTATKNRIIARCPARRKMQFREMREMINAADNDSQCAWCHRPNENSLLFS